MKRNIKISLLLLAFFTSTFSLSSQSLEFGLNAGLVTSQYTVSDNFLGNSTWIRQGSLDFATRIGGQVALKGTPDRYKAYETSMNHGLMAELSACRCGGKTEMVSRNAEGDFEVAEFDYVTWQTDFNLLYQAKFNRAQFLIGPSANFHTYRAVNYGNRAGDDYVYTQGQINQFYVGLEIGLGYQINNLLISSRYHTNITAFGEESNAVPVEYGNHQARLVFSYFLFEKRLRSFYRGLYF